MKKHIIKCDRPKNSRFINMDGLIFGRLTVVDFAGVSDSGVYYWKCKCKCGNVVNIQRSNLQNGDSKSCGCLNLELRTKHGHSKKYNHSRTYRTWAGMLSRCRNENDTGWHNYGGRGIKVCEHWERFENFIEDMGERPRNLTIERIENDKGYCKGNCRWATRREQSLNKRTNVVLTFGGKTQTAVQWSRELGFKDDAVAIRVNNGWTVEKTLTTPIQKKCHRI